MSAAFGLPIACGRCAGPVALVNATATARGDLSVAIVECPACEREWEITVRMVAHGPSRAAVERADAAKRASKCRRREELVPA